MRYAEFLGMGHCNTIRVARVAPLPRLETATRSTSSLPGSAVRPVVFYRWEVRTPAGRLYDRARTLLAPLALR